MLNSNLKDRPILLRMQLKSVIKCNTPRNRSLPECPSSARHALVYCLAGALKAVMICGLGMARRDWIMRALLGEQPPPGARAGTYCVDILCGHRIWRSRNWGRRAYPWRAICRVPGLCRIIGSAPPEPPDLAGSRRDQGLDVRQGPRHGRGSLRWSAPGKPAA